MYIQYMIFICTETTVKSPQKKKTNKPLHELQLLHCVKQTSEVSYLDGCQVV